MIVISDDNKFKLKEENKGITLIALIVTIIVLLILASVSIAMLTGENGILSKANKAKEETIEAEYKEKIELAVLASIAKNGKFSQDLLIEELKKYDLIGIKKGEETTVEANEKIYVIDSKGEITNKEIIKDITAQMVAENPEKYYGLKVTNYTSTNGQDDWRIFYSDGEHIFLIIGGYADLSVENRLNSNIGMTKVGTKYRVNWSTAPSSLQTLDNTVKTRVMATGYTLNSSNANSRCVSTLLNASNWEGYKDNSEMAEYAIGGSTVEMWMDSWNKRYPGDKLYCDNTNEYGYFVGTNSSPTDLSITSGIMQLKEGYNNSLYYPYHGVVSDGEDTCKSYWLAAPSACNYNNLLRVTCGSAIDQFGYALSGMGIRPVVSLNSGIKVNATNE